MKDTTIHQINKQRVLDCFTELVKIDSPSRYEADIAAYCKTAMEELGFTVRIDETTASTGSNTGNLIAFKPVCGKGKGSVVLSSHMDTVEPGRGIEPVIEGGVIKSKGETILGADDKSGIASIIEALRSADEQGGDLPNILVIFTTCEEGHLLGATAYEPTGEEKRIFDGAPCLVMDAEGKPGAITIGAPYHYVFEACFKGRASHAAVDPDKGINAIAMASLAISQMKLGSLGDVIVANVGSIEGGKSTNVVPASCKVKGECRALKLEEVEEVRRDMQSCMDKAASDFGGSVEVNWELSYPGTYLERDDELVVALEKTAKRIGLPFSADYSAGGSDANILGEKGFLPVAVSTGMQNFHAISECIEVSDLQNCAFFVLNALYDLA